jgi:HEAT repeat protein
MDSGLIEAFRILGPSASSAIPELASLATAESASSPDIRRDSEHMIVVFGLGPLLALGGIGSEALPALLTILTNSSSPGSRYGTVQAISAIGTNAVSALPVLIPLMRDENEMMASEAIGAVGVVGARRPEALGALRIVLQDPRVQLRGQAMLALGTFGVDAAPDLVKCFDEPRPGCYNIAFHVLASSAPEALLSSNVLVIAAEGLSSSDPDRRFWAAEVLRAAGQQADGIKPDLMVPGGRTDGVLSDATNALRRLAPELLH